MPTIWDPSARQEILERFARLTPAARPGWGKMNALEMVRHCTLALDMMVGNEGDAEARAPAKSAAAIPDCPCAAVAAGRADRR